MLHAVCVVEAGYAQVSVDVLCNNTGHCSRVSGCSSCKYVTVVWAGSLAHWSLPWFVFLLLLFFLGGGGGGEEGYPSMPTQ